MYMYMYMYNVYMYSFKKASMVPCVFFPAAFSSAAAVFSFAASAALTPLWV